MPNFCQKTGKFGLYSEVLLFMCKKYSLTYCFFFSILELMNGMVARRLRVMDFVFVVAVAGVIVFLFLRLGRNSDDSKKRLLVQLTHLKSLFST